MQAAFALLIETQIWMGCANRSSWEGSVIFTLYLHCSITEPFFDVKSLILYDGMNTGVPLQWKAIMEKSKVWSKLKPYPILVSQ